MNTFHRYLNGQLVERIIDGVSSAAVNPQKSPVRHRTTWPVALLPLKLLAQPSDRGAGDIIARTIGPIGGDAFKKWYKTLFGKSCGCGARQEVLNRRWPLQTMANTER